MSTVRTGDVIVVRSVGPLAWLIRLGAWIQRKPHNQDHVAIVIDDAGTVVEASPFGVQLGHVADYEAKWTISNASQPKSDSQRAEIAALAKSFLRYGYDFEAIAADASNVFDLHDPWVSDWTPDRVPHTFVCSSLAAFVYGRVGLGCPVGGRFVEPCDWTAWILEHHYQGQ